MNESSLKTNSKLKAEVDRLIEENKALEQALAKRKEDIDKLTNELEAAKKTCAHLQTKLTTLYPIAVLALKHWQSQDHDSYNDDIGEIIRTLRGLK